MGVHGVGGAGAIQGPQSGQNPLEQILQKVENWLDGLSPDTPAYQAATALKNEIERLLPKGTLSDLQNWYNQSFNNPSNIDGDLWWQFVGISESDATKFANFCGVQQTPPMTPQDKAYTELFALYNLAQGDDKKFFFDLISGLNNSHTTSYCSWQDFQNIALDYAGGPNFSRYPDISQQAKNDFNIIFGLGS